MSGHNEDWYVHAFRSDYLIRYSHRDDALAEKEARFVIDKAEIGRQHSVLDIGCGAGRHLIQLCSRGYCAIGVDLSPDLLGALAAKSQALAATHQPPSWRPPIATLADMRSLPFMDSTFDVAMMLFTSFGYFSDSENAKTMSEVARILRPYGRFILDIMNPKYVTENLVPESHEERDGYQITSIRSIRGKRVEKQILMADPEGQTTEYLESVRMYSHDEMSALLATAGFRVCSVWGDFDDVPYDEHSQRMIFVAQRDTE